MIISFISGAVTRSLPGRKHCSLRGGGGVPGLSPEPAPWAAAQRELFHTSGDWGCPESLPLPFLICSSRQNLGILRAPQGRPSLPRKKLRMKGLWLMGDKFNPGSSKSCFKGPSRTLNASPFPSPWGMGGCTCYLSKQEVRQME